MPSSSELSSSFTAVGCTQDAHMCCLLPEQQLKHSGGKGCYKPKNTAQSYVLSQHVCYGSSLLKHKTKSCFSTSTSNVRIRYRQKGAIQTGRPDTTRLTHEGAFWDPCVYLCVAQHCTYNLGGSRRSFAMIITNAFAMGLSFGLYQGTCSVLRTSTWESSITERICEYIRNQTKRGTSNKVHLQTHRLRNVQIQHPQ